MSNTMIVYMSVMAAITALVWLRNWRLSRLHKQLDDKRWRHNDIAVFHGFAAGAVGALAAAQERLGPSGRDGERLNDAAVMGIAALIVVERATRMRREAEVDASVDVGMDRANALVRQAIAEAETMTGERFIELMQQVQSMMGQATPSGDSD